MALHDITFDDPLLGGFIDGPDTLNPGASANIQVNYFLTQADVDAGHVINSATATGLDPSNNVVNAMAQFDVLLH